MVVIEGVSLRRNVSKGFKEYPQKNLFSAPRVKGNMNICKIMRVDQIKTRYNKESSFNSETIEKIPRREMRSISSRGPIETLYIY